jgi:hypothetical protein
MGFFMGFVLCFFLLDLFMGYNGIEWECLCDFLMG